MRGTALSCLVLVASISFAASNLPFPSRVEGSPKNNAEPVTTSNQSASEPRGTASAPLFVQSIGTPESADETAHKHYEHYQKPTLERLMGWGTFWLAVFTLFLVIGTAVLAAITFLLWRDAVRSGFHQSNANRRSLNIARKSAEAAKVAADAATATVTTMQDIGYRQLRPYVFCAEGANYEPVFERDGQVSGYLVWFVFRNSGQTPALGTGCELQCSSQRSPIFTPHDYPERFDIGLNGEVKTGRWPIKRDAMQLCFDKKIDLTIYARVEYRSDLRAGVTHHHELCLQLIPKHNPSTLRQGSDHHISFYAYGTQNSSS
jgi:hypothetical protein